MDFKKKKIIVYVGYTQHSTRSLYLVFHEGNYNRKSLKNIEKNLNTYESHPPLPHYNEYELLLFIIISSSITYSFKISTLSVTEVALLTESLTTDAN